MLYCYPKRELYLFYGFENLWEKRDLYMKKQYETPVVSSLRYVLAEGIAAPNGPDIGDIEINISSLIEPWFLSLCDRI